MKSKTRISDIAARSGVSPATVSLVLNGKPGVSHETRSRVLDAAVELKYPLPAPCPPASGSNLTTVGMVVKIDVDRPPHANPFYSKVMLGIEEACRRAGINLMFSTVPVDDSNRPTETPALLTNQMVDGLLMVGIDVNPSLASLARAHDCPLVLVDGYSTTDQFDRVVSDNFHAAYQVVEYLLAKGHSQIGLAGGEPGCYPSIVERRAGFTRALKDNDIAGTFYADFNINRSNGQTEIQNLLRENPTITALFCVNDEIASAAVRAAFEIGMNVPDDLSIIGYDDTYLASGSHPSLTSMRVDTVALGRAAVHLLSLRVENPESARMTLTIHPTLKERESVSQCKPQL
ncbi:MAG: LacI family DNA-binding transcriptional regulator [Anaerolineaceae bacterium]